MTLGFIINRIREKLGEPDPDRFTNAFLTDAANDSQMQIALDLDHPEATMIVDPATSPYLWNGFPLWQVPFIIKLLRIYMITPAGTQQPLNMTDIPTLQGDIIERYDQSSGTQVGVPAFTPQWKTQPASAFPVQSQINGIKPTGRPYETNLQNGQQTPEVFFTGGYMGVVPSPILTGGYTIGIDYIPSPPVLVRTNDLSIYPDFFIDAISYKAVAYCKFSDQDTQMTSADQLYLEQLKMKLRPWKDNLMAIMPKRMTPVTKRSYFRGQYNV